MTENARLRCGAKSTPYWHEALPPSQQAPGAVPARADVVIIGGGLTGCAAAATLAAAGRETVILEAETPGYGASARGAGFFSRHFKHSLTDLAAKRGEARALRYFHGLERAFNFTLGLIKQEQLDCALQQNGRFIAAMDAAGMDALQREHQMRGALLGEKYEVLEDGAEVEYRSPMVRGGILLRDQAAIHPGLYAAAMAARAERAGAALLHQTPALGVKTRDGGFVVSTPRGEVAARELLIATNGYTDAALPAIRRRLVPIRGYMLATEKLPADLLADALPNNRTYTDRRKASNYLRLSPDGSRLIFGGQTGAALEDDLDEIARRLRGELAGILPQFATVKFSHVWTGRCAATLDMIPKIGRRDGAHFALGYCFSGNALAPFFGHQTALRMLGESDEELPFEARRFRAIPFHGLSARIVPIVQKYYELLDMAQSRR